LREDGEARADAAGALLGNAVEEAVRTVTLLELGAWRSLRIEAKSSILQVEPAGDGLVVLAARPGTPRGWVVRSGSIVASIARAYLGGGTHAV
jgi:hypothetical protein